MSKRMKVISEEEYLRLINYRKPNILPDTGEKLAFFNQQSKAEHILNENVPDDIKVQLYSQYQNARNSKLDKITRKKPEAKLDLHTKVDTDIENELNKTDQLLLNGLPVSLRWKGSFLLNVLKRFPQYLTWNEKGQCNFFKDGIDPKTNITDLIRFCISGLRWTKALPVGINRFLFALKIINVPTSILSTQLRTELTNHPLAKPRGNRPSTAFFKNWEEFAEEDNSHKERTHSEGETYEDARDD